MVSFPQVSPLKPCAHLRENFTFTFARYSRHIMEDEIKFERKQLDL